MQTTNRERELTFDVDDGFVVPALDVRSRDAGPGTTEQVTLTATYWDTPSWALLRWGHTLRHRTASDGSEDGWTFKLAGGAEGPAQERLEIDVAGDPARPPAEIGRLLAGLVRHESLVPVATIVTQRERALHEVAGGTAVEVSDDHVRSTVGDRPGPTFRQIEVELVDDRDPDAARQLLDEARAVLCDAGAALTGETKLDRVLEDVGARADRPAGPSVALGRGASIAEVVTAALAAGSERLLAHDPGVRLGDDVEAVHQARVATRRLRSDLRTLESVLDRRWVDRIRSELSWLGGLLGAVRDLDVLGERLREQIDALPPADPPRDRRAPAEGLLAILADERRVRHLELVDVMGGRRYLALVDDLCAAAGEPPLGAGVKGARRADRLLRDVNARAWRRTAKAERRLGADPSDAELHEIRKRAKRARYAAELAADALPKADRRRARGYAARLADLQDVLGDLQDAVTAEAWLGGVDRDGQAPRLAFLAGELTGAERTARTIARQEWPAAWDAASRPKRRAWQ